MITETPFRRLLIPALLLAFAATASAQLQVGLSIPRRFYMAYEPVIVTVTIDNRTGHDVTLHDEGINAWFGFQVSNGDEHIVGPRDPNYHLDPLPLPAGQSVKRSVNLGNLFPVSEYGVYHIKATVFLAETGRYFTSPPAIIEVSEGKTIWRQNVGVPDGTPGAGETRVISLLSFRQPKTEYLYVRVEDPDAGKMLSTFALGRLLIAFPPSIELDRDNQVHVLQVVGPKIYTYTRIGVNGEFLGQQTFIDVKSRPHLVHNATGSVEVKGGQVEVPAERQPGATPGPKLSDRPAGMPSD